MKMLAKLGAITFLALTLLGCNEQKAEAPEEPPLARAGAAYIYQSDLDHHLSTYADKERDQIISDPATMQRFLESIAISEVMAQRQESLLSDEELQSIEASIRAYRRQRLATSYAAAKMSGHPITMAELKTYYDSHSGVSGDGGTHIPFEEAIPQLRRELGLRLLRDQMAEERIELNKDIEYFD